MGFNTIADGEEAVIGEDGADVVPVSLKLLVSLTDGGVGVGSVFEFDEDEWNAIDEEDNIRAALGMGAGSGFEGGEGMTRRLA